jgi:adenine-specific DNA-methyltransferase
MIKDTVIANESVSVNDRDITVLKENFPGCFKTDGSFDIEKLATQLKSKVNILREGYELNFLGKSYAKLIRSIDTTTVIKPDLEHNEKEENNESTNIYISGDNIDALKHLLKSYARSVKCIYIDPPYNTGTDGFTYNDNFNFTVKELEEKLSIDEQQAQKIIDLTSRKSSSHSAWLTFMYSRLLLARDLLTNDGVIFISIDNNEQPNLKLLCDDVFGEENFIECLTWNKRVPKNDKGIGSIHEYVLVYVREVTTPHKFTMPKEGLDDIWEMIEKFKKKKLPINEAEQELRKLYEKNGYDRGITLYNNLDENYEPWGKINMSWPNANTQGEKYKVPHPKTGEPVKIPDRGWRWIRSTFNDHLELDEQLNYKNVKERHDGSFVCGQIWFDKDEKTQPSSITYLRDVEKLLLRSILSFKSDGGLELEELFDGKSIFSYPKTTSLLTCLINSIPWNDGDIVLDFFSGSATTAEAVMMLNANDGIKRRYIMVQLPEDLDEKHEIASSTEKQTLQNTIDFLDSINKPHTLNEIGKERIRRAARKLKETTGAEIDYGFKCYDLYEPNQNTLDKMVNFDPESLVTDKTIYDDFGLPTILTSWLVKDGYGFSVEAEEVHLHGYVAYLCKKHLYLINPNITEPAIQTLIEKFDVEGEFNPENIVLFGYNFINWSHIEMIKTNIKQLNNGEKNLNVKIQIRY